MKGISSVLICCGTYLGVGGAHAAMKVAPTPARLMMWTPGECIAWEKCSSVNWAITSALTHHPRGDEADPPESFLEIEVLDKIRHEPATYRISVAQALRRGYSLEGLRYVLNDEGWKSILAIKIEDGRLTDFVLMPACDVALVNKAKKGT